MLGIGLHHYWQVFILIKKKKEKRTCQMNGLTNERLLGCEIRDFYFYFFFQNSHKK